MRRFAIVMGILMLFFVALAAVQACSVSDDDDDDTSDEGPTPKPSTHTKKIEAIAVGDRVYRYHGGLWETTDNIPTQGLPFQSVDFQTAGQGWVGGTGYVYRVDGDVWTLDSPLIQTNIPIHRIHVGADGRVWALANRFEESGGLLMIRGLDSLWSVTQLDDLFGVGSLALDLQELPGGSVAVLLRVDQSFYIRTFASDGTFVDTPVYQFDPLNWLTLRSLGLSGDGSFLVGGRRNDGINRLGNVWSVSAEGLVATDPPTATCSLEDVSRITRIDTAEFFLGLCNHTAMYRRDNAGAWAEVSLPGDKGSEWRVSDMAFLNSDLGWAVGYSDTQDSALLLLRDPAGWIDVTAPDNPEGVHLYGVDVWMPALDSDDDADDDADDDTGDDDTDDDTDDDATDDDVADDDEADDDVADDDETDDDEADDDAAG